MSETVPTSYDRAFFADLRVTSQRSAAAVAPILLDIIAPRSVLDVGCGDGTWLEALSRAGLEDFVGVDGAYALEAGIRIDRGRFVAGDVSMPIELGRRFDLAICLEVGEHLQADRASTLVQTVTSHAPAVLFSAAVPGQGGTHHVNEQWPQFWADRFQARGYLALDLIRPLLWENRDVAWWYAQNTVLYAEPSWVDARPHLRAMITGFGARALVHPALYSMYLAAAEARQSVIQKLVKRAKAGLRTARDGVLTARRPPIRNSD